MKALCWLGKNGSANKKLKVGDRVVGSILAEHHRKMAEAHSAN